MHDLAHSPFLCNVTSGHVEVEQAPFESAIARWYLAILLIEHNLSIASS